MKCNFCGTLNEVGSNFCASCGRNLSSSNSIISDIQTKTVNDENVVQENNIDSNNVNANNVEGISLYNATSNKKKNKKTSIIITIISLILVAILVILGVFFFNPSPKKIFTGFTSKLYGYANESLKK